jgi:hypothetical protein
MQALPFGDQGVEFVLDFNVVIAQTLDELGIVGRGSELIANMAELDFQLGDTRLNDFQT